LREVGLRVPASKKKRKREERIQGQPAVQVENVMTKEVSVCAPGTNAAIAAELMWKRNCGSLPVVDERGRVVGMITDRDLLIALGTSNRRASEVTVGEVMRENPSVCAPADTVGAALKTMAERQVRRLPVVDAEGALKGILSINDAVQHLGSDGDLSYEDAGRTLKSIGEPRAVKPAPKAVKTGSAAARKTRKATAPTTGRSRAKKVSA
jgi:CBS domain-containing protein